MREVEKSALRSAASLRALSMVRLPLGISRSVGHASLVHVALFHRRLVLSWALYNTHSLDEGISVAGGEIVSKIQDGTG